MSIPVCRKQVSKGLIILCISFTVKLTLTNSLARRQSSSVPTLVTARPCGEGERRNSKERERERQRERERERERGEREREEEEEWRCDLSVNKGSQCYSIRVLQFDVVCESVDDFVIRVYLIVVEVGQELVLGQTVRIPAEK